MDTTLGYDPHREQQARLQLALIAMGTFGGVLVLSLRARGDTKTADLLTLVGLVIGGVLSMAKVASSLGEPRT